MGRARKVMGRVLFAGGMIACVFAILYPLISNYLYSRRQDKIITEYTENVKQMDTEKLDAERKACEEYNRSINQKSTVITEVSGGKIPYGEAFKFDAKEYETRLNPEGNGMMGYVIIPKIRVYLPISHYATEEVLKNGVGHLPESSLPVGGKSSHTVLTGHTGSTGKTIFTDLVLMERGDHFFLNVLGELLVYQVDQILTVLPYEVEELMITEGEDFCTLVTCTPYGVNSHRLLVRGSRVEITEEMKAELLGEESEQKIMDTFSEPEQEEHLSQFVRYYLRAVLLGCILAGVLMVGIKNIRIFRRKKT